MSELKPVDCLPTITAEERQFLHHNPNTQDVVDWVVGYALASIDEWNRRAQPAAPADAAPSVAPEPVAWTLQSELDAAETTCSAHLWFTNPRNSAWTALFTREQIAAHPPRAPLTEEHVTAAVRSVCPNLAETSKAWRDLVVECRYWLEAAHGIGGK